MSVKRGFNRICDTKRLIETVNSAGEVIKNEVVFLRDVECFFNESHERQIAIREGEGTSVNALFMFDINEKIKFGDVIFNVRLKDRLLDPDPRDFLITSATKPSGKRFNRYMRVKAKDLSKEPIVGIK